MQEILSFLFKASPEHLGESNKRYLRGRYLIDRLRQAMGKVAKEISQTEDLSYLVGRVPGRDKPESESLLNVQNAASIAKWSVDFHQDPLLNQGSNGVLTLLLESAAPHSLTLIKSIVIQAAKKQGIDLSFHNHKQTELDYETTDSSQSYFIDVFVPRQSFHANTTPEERKILWSENYPFSNSIKDKEKLSISVGQAVKRHLIGCAVHHGLDTTPLQQSLFLFRAHWLTRPQAILKSATPDNIGIEAVTVSFSAPLVLSGVWSAGSMRHKGSGIIRQATPVEDKLLLNKGGVFVL